MSTVYVDPTNGNDTTGTGTSALPWQTLAHANTNSAADDTIIIKAGTHTVAADFTAGFSQARIYSGELNTFNRPNTILDYNGIYVEGTPNSPNLGAANTTLTIQRLIFQNINTVSQTPINASATDLSGVFYKNPASCNITFTQCIFRDILVGTAFASASVQQAYGSLLFINSNRGTLGTNTFLNCAFYDIGVTPGSTDSVIFGLSVGSENSVSLTNCTLSTIAPQGFNKVRRIFSSQNTSSQREDLTFTARNSIFYSEDASVIDLFRLQAHTTGTTTIDFSYPDNVVFGNFALAGGGVTGSELDNASTYDPLFVDTANGNYNLREASPAIGTIL